MVTPAKPRLNDPQWTEYQTTSGQDPLGMQNGSINHYQMLLPGIGNVTLRMRYYGLYAWLSWIYAQKIGDTNPERWKRFIRRSEALFALIAQQRGDETGVAGARWARRKLEATTGKTIDFSGDAEPGSSRGYFAIEWGVFGLAYRSQLTEIGILTNSFEHQIELPSVEVGDSLAKAFDKELGELAGPFYSAITRGKVRVSELDRFARLSASGIPKTSAERAIYEQVLFARGKTASANDHTRRLTLLLILKSAAHLKRTPTADDVRWILYANNDEHGGVVNWGTADLESHRLRWHAYQTNDLCHVALETMLKYYLDVLSGYPHGIEPSKLIARCVNDLIAIARPIALTWGELLKGLVPAANANDRQNPDSEWSLALAVLAARREEDICTPDAAWKAIMLLGIVQLRYRANTPLFVSELGSLNPDFFHSVLTECCFLERHDEAPLAEILGRLIDERVIRRHLWIALRKLRDQGDYTFLIECDDGLIRTREKNGPVFTNPRLSPAITFVRDIHLLNDSGITPRGAKLLEAA